MRINLILLLRVCSSMRWCQNMPKYAVTSWYGCQSTISNPSELKLITLTPSGLNWTKFDTFNEFSIDQVISVKCDSLFAIKSCNSWNSTFWIEPNCCANESINRIQRNVMQEQVFLVFDWMYFNCFVYAVSVNYPSIWFEGHIVLSMLI